MSQAILAWHGWGFGPAAFDPLRAALHGRCELSAPSLRPPSDGGFAAWAASLAPSVTSNQVLLGWSLGAMLAMGAVLAGARPRALVLIAGSARFAASADWQHGLATNTVAAFRSGIGQNPARTLQRFLALQALGDARRADVLARLEPARAHDAAALTPALDALIGADLREHVAEITTPTLIIHGTHDALMPAAGADWLAAQLTHASLMTPSDCGHAPHVSAPDAVATAIVRFIEALAHA